MISLILVEEGCIVGHVTEAKGGTPEIADDAFGDLSDRSGPFDCEQEEEFTRMEEQKRVTSLIEYDLAKKGQA